MNIPSGIKRVILPLMMLFVFAASWYGLFKPEMAKAELFRDKVEEINAQVDAMIRQGGNLYTPPAPEEIAEWDSLKVRIDKMLPAGRELTKLYSYLSELADNHNVVNFRRDLIKGSELSWTDGGIPRQSYDLSVTFDGDYRSVLEFLDELQRTERLIEITELSVSRNVPLISVRMVLRSYYSA